METFTEFKDFVANPRYNEQRQQSLSRLDIDQIDPPIIELISAFTKLPYCFTLQSCYGHFLHSRQKDHYNIEALPITDSIVSADYRIAHIGVRMGTPGENGDGGEWGRWGGMETLVKN